MKLLQSKDRRAVMERRDAALRQVDENASVEWKDEAWKFLVNYAASHAEIFVDDLWEAGLPHTREDRALGPLFLRGARERLMEKTGTYRASVRSNMTEKPVWRSLIH